MTEPPLPQKVLAVQNALGSAGVNHAFGGAIALAFYAVPRSTRDIDLNIFCDVSDWQRVESALAKLGVDTTVDQSQLLRDEQCRIRWGRTPLDLFFAYAELHMAMKRSLRLVPFAGETIPILGPDHLIVCKAIFDRPKDWLDIEQMLVAAEGLDRAEIERWLNRVLGEQSHQLQRFDKLADELLGRAVDRDNPLR